MEDVDQSPLQTAFVDAWMRWPDISSRTTRTLAGNFVFANALLLIPLGIMFAAISPALKFGVLSAMIAIWFPLPALIIRRLNDAGLPRLFVVVPVLSVIGVFAFPMFGFNVEKDLIEGEYWLEGQILEVLSFGALVILLAKSSSENRFGNNPRHD